MKPAPGLPSYEFSQSWKSTLQYYEDLINSDMVFADQVPIYLYVKKKLAQGADRDFFAATDQQKLLFFRKNLDRQSVDEPVVTVKLSEDIYEISFLRGKKMQKQFQTEDLDDSRFESMLNELKEIPLD